MAIGVAANVGTAGVGVGTCMCYTWPWDVFCSLQKGGSEGIEKG